MVLRQELVKSLKDVNQYYFARISPKLSDKIFCFHSQQHQLLTRCFKMDDTEVFPNLFSLKAL